MSRRFLGQIIFLRHGQTDYTDVFPDLTKEGQAVIRDAAEKIKSMLFNDRNVVITASPAVRAKGSAAIVAEVLGYNGKKIIEEQITSCAAIKDKKRAIALFNEHFSKGGIDGLSLAYNTDPRYEDGEVIEPRSKVHQRFLKYLSKSVCHLLVCRTPLCIINVSHYEFLYYFVELVFNIDYQKEKPLGHGESIVISVFDVKQPDVVGIKVSFRNKKAEKRFNYKERTLLKI